MNLPAISGRGWLAKWSVLAYYWLYDQDQGYIGLGRG